MQSYYLQLFTSNAWTDLTIIEYSIWWVITSTLIHLQSPNIQVEIRTDVLVKDGF